MADRVSYTFNVKMSKDYGAISAGFQASLSSDVKADETEDEAFERVRAKVQEWGDKEYESISEIIESKD